MSEKSLVSIAGMSRREVIRGLALALTGSGVLDRMAAQEVHQAARAAKRAGNYKPQGLTEHEFATVARLAELIVPADERGGSAVEAGAPEFIDILCSQNPKLADIYHGGILWLDAQMLERHGGRFVETPEAQQVEMLDLLAETDRLMRIPQVNYSLTPSNLGYREYSAAETPELAPGAEFFDWVRKMSVDAYYTSEIGYKDLDYRGNAAHSEYKVPEKVITYLKEKGALA